MDSVVSAEGSKPFDLSIPAGGDIIRIAREEAGLPVEVAAANHGVSVDEWTQFEGSPRLRFSEIVAIAPALNMSAEDILNASVARARRDGKQLPTYDAIVAAGKSAAE